MDAEIELGVGEHFKHWAEGVAYAAKQLTSAEKSALSWYKLWLREFAKLYDNFEAIRAADPMMVYQPRNSASEAFHKSPCFVRYYQGGNRTSKTTSGYAEHYFAVTGYHPFRAMPPGQASTFLVAGLPFSDYAPRVFEKKMCGGEDGNILSPMFPEGGKWFYHYDKRKYLLTIACSECANKGKAGSCPGHHVKPTIALCSAQKGVGVIEAFTARLGHGDEHLPDEFYDAMKMRVGDQKGYLVFTGTPTFGMEAWEIRRLKAEAESPTDPNKPLVSFHKCSKYDGNIVSREQIDIEGSGMDEFEFRARILGEAAPLAKNPVFDRHIIDEMRGDIVEPKRGELSVGCPLAQANETTTVNFDEAVTGPLRVWRRPEELVQYLVAVDTAAGLTKPSQRNRGDFSCASVLKLTRSAGQLYLELVAQYHQHITILEYADEVFKLALYYNSALVVVELTGGYGRGVLERLSGGRDGLGLCYWNIFRDTTKPEYAMAGQDARFGLDTTSYNKASMVAALQYFIKKQRIKIPCKDTIMELVAYEQERTELGNARFRGAGGAHDDRVMSLVMAAAVATSYPVFDITEQITPVAGLEQYNDEWKSIHKELKAQEKPDPFL